MKRLTILMLLALTPAMAWAGDDDAREVDAKISGPLKALMNSGHSGFVDVIIQFDGPPGQADDHGIAAAGGKKTRDFNQLRMRAARIPAKALEALSHNPNISFVSRDAPVQALSESARETANLPDEAVNYSYYGWGMGVAVLDSGVGNTVDIWPSPTQYDFVGQPSSPVYGLFDTWGHGTHVAGVIGGDGYDSDEVYRGVAPYTDIISLRVLNSQGQGVTSDVIAALDWLLVNASTYNIRVANLSLGKAIEEPAADDPLIAAVEAVWDAGIVVVCSAGNHGRDGYFTITSPGNSRKVITVGSLTDNGTGGDFEDDYASTYSSRGPTFFDHFVKPDLLAPGNRVVAPISYEAQMRADLPDRLVDCGKPSCSGFYIELSGTSMAAAMVSGAAATMIDEEPGIGPDTVKARLMRSAKKVDVGDPFTTGAGLLDIEAALEETGYVTSAPSPKAFRNEQTGQMGFENTAVLWGDLDWAQSLLWGDSLLWDESVLWGDSLVWSDSLLWDESLLWGDSLLWSDSLLWDESVLWGDSLLWDESLLWSDSLLWGDAVLDQDPLYSLSSQTVQIDDD